MKTIAVTLIAAAAMFSAAAQTTSTTSTRSFAFPAVGLGATETAEVDLVNTAANSTAGTAASCTGTVTFVNAAGVNIGTAGTFTLTSGQISSVRLPFSGSGGTGLRTVVRAVVTVTLPTATPRPPCSLESTLETYDTATGATHSLLTGSVETYSGRN